MRKKLAILVPCVLAVIVASFGLCEKCWSASNARPNVLLILIDNQAYFELSCKGHSFLHTPHIDALAGESVDFCNFHAENFCSPSRAALLTGRQPMRLGVYDTIGGVSLLPARETTLADRLRAAGYRTGIFGKWHLGMSYPFHPSQRGFDDVFIHGGGGIGQLEDYAGNRHLNAHFQHDGIWEPTTGYSTNVLFDQAEGFIRKCGREPFFCFLPTPAPHFPYQPEAEALKRIQARGVSAADTTLFSMIENIDDNVGRILDCLEVQGIAENTLVILMSDQGMGYRGASFSPPSAAEHANLGNASDASHQVFCLVRKPGLTVASKNYALSCIRDIFPTVLEICGAPIPDDPDSQSLVPLLGGAAQWATDRTLVMQCPRARKREKWKHAAVKSGNWRLVQGNQLFDVQHDPMQQHNVATDHPEVVKQLTEAYDAFWNSLPPEETLVSRHQLGATESPATHLCAMDWYRGDAPWTQNELETSRAQGAWAVQVARSGRYQFTLRRSQRETPRPLGASYARVEIGEKSAQVDVAPGECAAAVELDLDRGTYDLQAWLAANDGRSKSWGANFVEVKLLSDGKAIATRSTFDK